VRVVPQPAGGTNHLLRNAIPGDQTIFLDALTDISDSGSVAGSAVEISGPHGTEYHRVHLFTVQSDAEGYFRLPPISRVAMMQLHASHPGSSGDVEMMFSPDYERFENRIDLIFG
jgi:hypothetical protein